MQHVSRPASEPSTYVALLDAPGSRSFISKHDTYHYSLVSLVKSKVSRLPCNTVRLGRVRPRRVENWCVVWGATKKLHRLLDGHITEFTRYYLTGCRAVRARCNAEASRTLDCRIAEVIMPAGRSNASRRSKRGREHMFQDRPSQQVQNAQANKGPAQPSMSP